MGKLTAFIEALLQAAKVDDFQAKYPEIADEIQSVNDADPSSTKKYLEWGVKQLRKGSSPAQVSDAIKKFHAAQPRLENKDIGQYGSADEVTNAVLSIGEAKSVHKKMKREQARKDADYVWEDPDGRFLLIHPKTAEASIHYGKGTQWCISAEKDNAFDEYTEDGIKFYFLIDREGEYQGRWSKVAICIQRRKASMNDMFDALDDPTDIEQVAEGMGIDPEEVRSAVEKAIADSKTQAADIKEVLVTGTEEQAMQAYRANGATRALAHSLLKRQRLSAESLREVLQNHPPEADDEEIAFKVSEHLKRLPDSQAKKDLLDDLIWFAKRGARDIKNVLIQEALDNKSALELYRHLGKRLYLALGYLTRIDVVQNSQVFIKELTGLVNDHSIARNDFSEELYNEIAKLIMRWPVTAFGKTATPLLLALLENMRGESRTTFVEDLDAFASFVEPVVAKEAIRGVHDVEDLAPDLLKRTQEA